MSRKKKAPMIVRKHFNTAGPCKPDIHYMLPASARLPELRRLIEGQNYFVIHAPRQVGKTTTMMQLAQELTAEGRYTALLVSAEVGSVFNDDPGAAELAMLGTWHGDARAWLPADLRPPEWPRVEAGQRVFAALEAWSQTSPRPLAVFIDEIDALENGALISVLRQLRSGFRNRPHGFPWSLGLIGMRDVRDYKVKSGGSERLNTASPFNILARSLTISNFTADEVATLYQQHTTETGQAFTAEAVARAFALTQGQPYMVNALAKVAVEELVPNVTEAVTLAHIERAKEILIERRETHLDSLGERLREERVRRVIQPILTGDELIEVPEDDRRFVLDLGLVRKVNGGNLTIANPIYQEVIPRILAGSAQDTIVQEAKWYVLADGRLDMNKLLTAFQQFFREHSESWVERFDYKEAGPQLLLQAFLHRVVNGGGRIEREYGLGRGRTDLLIVWNYASGVQRVVLELKVLRKALDKTIADGLVQTLEYGERCDADELHFIVFDRSKKPWSKKIFKRTRKLRGTTIKVWGM
ncbi:MAG TPA: ATP-binding protein [Blastocatellia bacterium]|nr:ATP-binding protein [Blastocatellia bacterium]